MPHPRIAFYRSLSLFISLLLASIQPAFSQAGTTPASGKVLPAILSLLLDETSLEDSFSVSVSVAGNGVVSSQPAGINCGIDCSERFPDGMQISLIAAPVMGFKFDEWGGACTGADLCDLIVSEDRAVSASFSSISPSQYSLTVSSGANGKVVSQPLGIDCGSDCVEVFTEGQQVQLSAIPSSGFELANWSGGCSGAGSCAVTMTQDRSVTATFSPTGGGGTLAIADMGLHTISHGSTFSYQPAISGDYTICRKDLGHDDVLVDSETGAISWDTSGLTFGRGFYIRIKCSGATESAYAATVVHVDLSGSSQLRIAGQDGVSPYIGVAGQAMASGDTLVFPDGLYPVSVTGNETYENAFKRSSPTDGTATQFSTLIARNPGGVVISGAPSGNIPQQKNAFQFLGVDYVAVSGFVIKDIRRESLTTDGPANHLLIDFIGAAGAGTDGLPCSNVTEARLGGCSNAGMRVTGGTPLFQNSYDWGHNRYGIMTRSTTESVTRRSFVRLDEHKGDQPYGGFSNYCDQNHLSQDNTVFDSLAIAAPHYKNYAGLEAYPATGCESQSATLKTEGLFAVNNKLSLSLMDQQVGPAHIWDTIVSYDSEGTCTPQNNRCGNWLLQADKQTLVRNSFFGKARGFGGGTSMGGAFDSADVVLENSVALSDIPGQTNTGTAPEYLPESLLYFRGRSDTFYGDTGYDQVTNVRRWPIGGEDIIAANMRSYRNPAALKVGGGTVDINGDRGATALNESMSEYFWRYNGALVPPLVVRVKDKGSFNRVAWEPLNGLTKDTVTGWNVICVASANSVLASFASDVLVYNDVGKTCNEYGVKALYASGESGIAYTETPQAPVGGGALISQYTQTSAPFELAQFGSNGSGITWHAGLEQYLVVRNGAAIIYRYDSDFNYLSNITKVGNINNDTEGLAHVSGNQVMIVTEANYAHKAVIGASTSVISGNYDQTPGYRLVPFAQSNKGLEGVAVRPASGSIPARVYACQEGTGASATTLMKVVYFDVPSPDPTMLLSYDSNLTVVEPFNAETAFAGVITDCAGMVYDNRTGHLIIVSQESDKAIQVDPDTGEIFAELALPGEPRYEGVTIGPQGELVFIGEPNWVHIFARP